MQKVYKRKRKDKKTGKAKLDRTYTLKYKILDMEKIEYHPLGVTDKQVADHLAREFMRKIERILSGLDEPEKPKPKNLIDLLPQFIAEKSLEWTSEQYKSDVNG